MKVLHLVGRVIFGAFFTFNGVNHFLQLDMLAGYAASKGVPAPEVAVLVTGVMLVVGGLSLLLGYKPAIGLWILVLFLVPVAVIIHNFWAVPAEQQATEMAQFTKNIALAGASLAVLAFTDRKWPYSLGSGGETPRV